MMKRSDFYKINMLSLIIIVQAHWNNSLQIDMSLHFDTIFWLQAKQSLLIFLSAAYFVKKQIPII